MRQFPNLSFNLLSLAAVLALGAAACSTTDNTAPGTALLTQQQADSMSEQLALDVEDEMFGATATGSSAGYSAAPLQGGVSLSAPPPTCTPTRTPASPPDADADGVPDSVRFSFNNCVLTFLLETDTLKGTIDLVDPTMTIADRAVRRVFTNVAVVRVYTISGKFTSETRNGTRIMSRDATTLQHSETNFKTDYVFRDGDKATHLRTWTATYTADVAGSIVADQTLPSGSWNISGTSTWTRGTNAYSLTVSTNPAMHFNATCTVAPRFDSGTLTAVVTKGGQTQTVRIQATACGQFTVTRS